LNLLNKEIIRSNEKCAISSIKLK